MKDKINIAAFDELIDRTRAKFRNLMSSNPGLFSGQTNRLIEVTIGKNAPHGTISVPQGIDVSSTEGLMAVVDLTLLDRNAETSELEKIALRAKDEAAATVCVYPEHVAVVQRITGGNPPPIAVVGFPSVADPASALETTLEQTSVAIQSGAKEIDMVLAMNFKDSNPDYAAHYSYLQQVVAAAGSDGIPVKVILETAYLTDEQKVEASMLAKMAGAAFVKTSTGFANENLMRPKAPKGATPYDIALMRRTVGDTTLNDHGQEIPMGVKASGGVRNREQAIAVCQAGANRIGASSGIDLKP